ncbi:MAG: Ppx/GppA phosphatase family protein [Candidatus Stygibacter frigidus]|nr:Ppx/GppA phosphatase family protein [Candidatus Stygibacter frigidus]
MANYAILDIGTNSIKFMLFSYDKGKTEILIDMNNISRLGEGLYKTGQISPESMDRNIAVLDEFMTQARDYKVEEIIAVGTMCLRTAKNSREFLDRAKKELNLEIKVIPGEEEARLSYLAVLSTLGKTDKNVVVFDTGGGSTEFIFGSGLEFQNKISLNLGAVSPTEEFLSDPPKKEEVDRMLNFMHKFFVKEINGEKVDHLVGIGGTVTSMGAVMHKMTKYDPDVIQGSTITLQEVNRQLEMYKSKSVEDRKAIAGLQPKRADVILAGAGIMKTIMEILKIESLTISDRGLRHGLMFDRFH